MAEVSNESAGLLQGLVYDPETGLAVPSLAVYLVYLTIFVDTLAATISTPALPYYARKFGADNAHIGYLFAAWSFTSTFCAPILGRVSDLIGRRKILILSLLGAGTAAIAQGVAPTYWLLFAARAFSGVWTAVGSSAQVYITDVASPAALPDYMSTLSAVPGAAMIFGPGLGGGLSRFGLNVPILVDGCLSFVGLGKPSGPVSRTPHTVHVLGVAQFLNGISYGTAVSMTTVALNAKFGLDSLQVGYTFVVMAIAMLCTSVWLAAPAMKTFGMYSVGIFGSILSGLMLMGMALASNLWVSIACLTVSRVGTALKGASGGPITALFTDVSNRGQVFSMIQMYLNMGRLVGPLVAGHLATKDPTLLPWIVAGFCNISSAIVLGFARPRGEALPQRGYHYLVARDYSDLLDDADNRKVLEDEHGSPHDYQELGEFVGKLLSSRHYRWVTHKESVFRMLDCMLPELRKDAKDHVLDLEHLMRHSAALKKDFRSINERHF